MRAAMGQNGEGRRANGGPVTSAQSEWHLPLLLGRAAASRAEPSPLLSFQPALRGSPAPTPAVSPAVSFL